MIVSPEQKKYLDLAEKEKVVVKRGTKLIELIVRERTVTDNDVRNGLSLEEVREQVHKHIDKKFD